MSDNQYDLAIVDPPYGLDRFNKYSTQGAGWLKDRVFNLGNIKTWDTAPSAEYFDELRRVSKNQIIWGGNYFDLPPTRTMICWDKCQPWIKFSQIELAWTSFNRPASLFKYDNKYSGKIHPTQKPVRLYEWLLDNYAEKSDKILDTHLGSGSIAVACHNTGHSLDAYEIDENFYAAAQARLQEHQRQMRLF
jgi:site-specific DNA-methyltransferase (adenine-specific)